MDIERVEGMGFGRYLKIMTCRSRTLLSGLKINTPFSCLGQAVYLAGQLTLQAHLPGGLGSSMKLSYN